MATDNPKISLYVPQQIYDRFKEFATDRELTMSQAGIAILAEYFGLTEETKKNVVGGVTLEAFKTLQAELESLKNRVNYLEAKSNPPIEITKVKTETVTNPRFTELAKVEKNQTTSEPLKELNKQDDEGTNKQQENSNLQLKLLSEPQEIRLEAKHLAKRINSEKEKVTTSRIASKVGSLIKKDSTEEFVDWTKKLDPDDIGWGISKNPYGRKGSAKQPLYYYVPYNASKEQIELLEQWLLNNNLSGKTPSMAVNNIEGRNSQPR